MSNNFLIITTFNRIAFLKNSISTWQQTKSDKYSWQIIIADDGSTDGTIEYIENLIGNSDFNITMIKNNRKGIHHQTNTIIKELSKMDFDYAFICNDDIRFLKPGWDVLYISAIKASKFQHLCFYDTKWESSKTLKTPSIKGNLISNSEPLNIQGAFFTITPQIIEEVGYMDCENFGFRGLGHVDYSLRCARARFNDPKNIFDALGSNDYISCTNDNYHGALPQELVNSLDSESVLSKKHQVILDKTRLYIAYNEYDSTLDKNTENELWEQAIKRKLDEIEFITKERNYYKSELNKTIEYYSKVYERLPKLVKHIIRYLPKSN